MVYRTFANANLIINMKSTIIATLGLLAMALPASAAYVVQPGEYAKEYCQLRNLGWNNLSSVEYAIEASMVKGLPVEIYHNGSKVDADVLVAFQAAKYLCPEYH